MTTEPIADIAEKVLVRLRDSKSRTPEGFVEICAADFDITDHVQFARELDSMRRKKWIAEPAKQLDLTQIDFTRLNFVDVIAENTTRVLIAITVKGKRVISKIPVT